MWKTHGPTPHEENSLARGKIPHSIIYSQGSHYSQRNTVGTREDVYQLAHRWLSLSYHSYTVQPLPRGRGTHNGLGPPILSDNQDTPPIHMSPQANRIQTNSSLTITRGCIKWTAETHRTTTSCDDHSMSLVHLINGAQWILRGIYSHQ